MYISLLQIKNFRCFDGNEHSITFKKGLNVLVGENDSGKSAIMDAIKLVLGTTDMNWYRVEQEDFYKEDATLKLKLHVNLRNTLLIMVLTMISEYTTFHGRCSGTFFFL